MGEHYILQNRKPVPVDLLTWAAWFEDAAERFVKKTTIGDSEVSTVFLGLDHAFGFDVEPKLFETMIFGGPLDQYQERCATWDQAEAMHADAVKRAQFAHDAQMGGAETS